MTTPLAVGVMVTFLRTANGGTRWDTGKTASTGVVGARSENLQAVQRG